jgi:fatty-acid desaturase
MGLLRRGQQAALWSRRHDAAYEGRSVRWKKDNVYGFLFVHLIAGLSFFPWFFSWTGVALLGVGIFVFGLLGINLCYHRLLTHRGFSCPLWCEHTLAIFGVCAVQDSPPHWVAVHRRHHQFADEDNDPHSPLAGLFWAHMGWLLVKMEDMGRRSLIEQYAKDIVRDPLYAWIERRSNWIKIALGSWVAYVAVGFGVIVLSGGVLRDAVQFGLSLFVWGAALRIVLLWHLTWSVNSVTHIWGYRNYGTPDVSRNNALIALIAGGEGWHNNHHADSRSARHGHKWWEIDLTWMVIRLLMLLGLARNVAVPSPTLAAKFNASGQRLAPPEQESWARKAIYARTQSDADRIDAPWQLLHHLLWFRSLR